MRALLLVLVAPALGACWGGDYYDSTPSYSAPASTSSGSTTDTTRQRSERTIVRRDGTVVVVQRDPDGTRTYADSRGNYGVRAPYYSSSGRRR